MYQRKKNDDEMKIKVLTVLGEVQHPEYSYPLEKGGTQRGKRSHVWSVWSSNTSKLML